MRCLILSACACVSWPSLTIWSIVCSSACFRSFSVWLWLRWRMPASFWTNIWPGPPPLGDGEGVAARATAPMASAATAARGAAMRSFFLFPNTVPAVLIIRAVKVLGTHQISVSAHPRPLPRLAAVALQQLLKGLGAEVQGRDRHPFVRGVDRVQDLVGGKAQRQEAVAD